MSERCGWCRQPVDRMDSSVVMRTENDGTEWLWCNDNHLWAHSLGEPVPPSLDGSGKDGGPDGR